MGVRTRVARSRELIAKGRQPAAVARIMQVNRTGLYRVPQRRPRGQVPVTLVVRDPDLLRMFEVVGLTSKFGTYPTVDAALSSKAERARHEYRTNFGRTRRPGRLKLTTDGSAANALEQ